MMKHIVLTILLFITPSVFAEDLSVQDDIISITCENPRDCQQLCQAATCPIAKLTCEGCAKASDPALHSVFRSLHVIYQQSAKPVLAEVSKIRPQPMLALTVDSPLNIFADPFNPAEATRLQSSFDSVCQASGRHVVLAEVGPTLTPHSILCESVEGIWSWKKLELRPEFYNGMNSNAKAQADLP
jgi:hypothetical protein